MTYVYFINSQGTPQRFTHSRYYLLCFLIFLFTKRKKKTNKTLKNHGVNENKKSNRLRNDPFKLATFEFYKNYTVKSQFFNLFNETFIPKRYAIKYIFISNSKSLKTHLSIITGCIALCGTRCIS